jgi:hypothetical protein
MGGFIEKLIEVFFSEALHGDMRGSFSVDPSSAARVVKRGY